MRIRGHHLVCTYCFYGSGKETAEEFFGVANAIPRLLHQLRNNPDMQITVMTGSDDVCNDCPLRVPEGCNRGADAYAQNDKLRGWDKAILDVLGLREGERIKAKELECRITEKIPDISIFCTNCTSAAPSGWHEYRKAVRKGLWPDNTIPGSRT